MSPSCMNISLYTYLLSEVLVMCALKNRNLPPSLLTQPHLTHCTGWLLSLLRPTSLSPAPPTSSSKNSPLPNPTAHSRPSGEMSTDLASCSTTKWLTSLCGGTREIQCCHTMNCSCRLSSVLCYQNQHPTHTSILLQAEYTHTPCIHSPPSPQYLLPPLSTSSLPPSTPSLP